MEEDSLSNDEEQMLSLEDLLSKGVKSVTQASMDRESLVDLQPKT